MTTDSTTGTNTGTRGPGLTTIAAIRARYEQPGPHASAVVDVPKPGTVGDDLDVRWSAVESELRSLGASERTVANMGDALRATHRRGHPLLVTANDHDAATCWLGFDIEPSISLGPLPALLPAAHQAALVPAPTVAAVIDRTGADLYVVGALDLDTLRAVDGDDEQIHKALGGGMSQPRHQRHSEVIWERNAELIAAAITNECASTGANGVVLTGDEREVNLVRDELVESRVGPVRPVRAGGRHEPTTPDRVRSAALDFRAERHRRLVERSLDDLREELGQRDQAIAGSVEVLEAITDNRVKTLFVDLDVGARSAHVDATIRAALAHGADLVTGTGFDLHDGIAAILRIPYT
ncbi:baeRF2 domain-containing protein [Ilumatobacter coccineus]|uniref:eRF1 domain-containing protein n=1 Tax=Ilumatobacter coccineus (strain NBRC 103263 / KCTC 29153 / YM16-304) TaxID=1313172 RepID=A0A6C7E9W9_ILUCY|nr:Vms1/Ankzf1 family peptidyl-tRNA hydrolase [Ilumatobacter coccineus]BAN03517.1 hypothetical protein YM304_32030 [Ilumatobacter coccineus YM16-304]